MLLLHRHRHHRVRRLGELVVQTIMPHVESRDVARALAKSQNLLENRDCCSVVGRAGSTCHRSPTNEL